MPLTESQHAEIEAQRSALAPTRRATVPALEEMLFQAVPLLDHGFIRVIDYMGDEILDIADDASNDWMERLGEDEKSRGWRENGEAINRSRLRVDARKWLMSKIMPKKYGDHVSLQHSGTLTLEALVGASFKAPEKE